MGPLFSLSPARRARRAVRLVPAIAMLMMASPAAAKDPFHLWYVTTSLGFHTTEDEVRNNATLPGDPRPGQEDDRTGVIEDGVSLSLSAGFGMTPRLALQLDTGWFSSDVGPVDGFLAEQYPVAGNPFDPTSLTTFTHQTSSFPATAGTLSQIPVSLSLIARFRKDTAFNPFVGAGAGMIFTDIDADEQLDALNARISHLRVREIFDEHGEPQTPTELSQLRAPGLVPPGGHQLSITADDAFEWHLTAGLEYVFGERASFVASASYTFTDGAVEFLAGDEDQVTFLIYPEALFREDGSLKIFNSAALFPNPYNDPADPTKGIINCVPNTVGDFDHDGHADDQCYRNNDLVATDDPTGDFLIQGGRIEYGGFTINLGLRFYF